MPGSPLRGRRGSGCAAGVGRPPVVRARIQHRARPVPTTLSASLAEAEMHLITEVLAKHRNNRLRAAAELGISRMALYNKLHKYGLFATT